MGEVQGRNAESRRGGTSAKLAPLCGVRMQNGGLAGWDRRVGRERSIGRIGRIGRIGPVWFPGVRHRSLPSPPSLPSPHGLLRHRCSWPAMNLHLGAPAAAVAWRNESATPTVPPSRIEGFGETSLPGGASGLAPSPSSPRQAARRRFHSPGRCSGAPAVAVALGSGIPLRNALTRGPGRRVSPAESGAGPASLPRLSSLFVLAHF